MATGPATILLATWISSTLALATVTLRLYTRTFIVRSLGSDDFTIILAMLFSLGLSLLWSFQTHYGFGQHLATIPPSYRSLNLTMTWAALFPYYAALCLVKVSALLQCLRLFKTTRVQTACLALLASVAAFGIWTIVSALLTCHHRRRDGLATGSVRCTSQLQLPFLYANAGVHILTDILITALPLNAIARLARLTARQKRGLIAVFALGLLARVPSILRLHALTRLTNHILATDFTHALIPTYIWTATELNTTIVCACLPACTPLFTRLFSCLRRSAQSMALSRAGSRGEGRAEPKQPVVVEAALVVVAAPRRRDSDEVSDLTDLAEFAGFAGLTGDPDWDRQVVLARQQSVAAVGEQQRGDSVASRWARPDDDGDDDEGYEGRGSTADLVGYDAVGILEGRASSTIEVV